MALFPCLILRGVCFCWVSHYSLIWRVCFAELAYIPPQLSAIFMSDFSQCMSCHGNQTAVNAFEPYMCSGLIAQLPYLMAWEVPLQRFK